MYHDSSPCCTVFPNLPGTGLTFPPPPYYVNFYAKARRALAPWWRSSSCCSPPVLREVVPTDGAHRRRSVRARATTGGAEKVRGRFGGLPGPPRAVPHLPAGGAGAVRSRHEPDGQQGRDRGRSGVRRLPAPLPRGPEGSRRPAHEGGPALAAGPAAREGPGEDAGGDQGLYAVPGEGAGHPARPGSLREDPRAAKPARTARGDRGTALHHPEQYESAEARVRRAVATYPDVPVAPDPLHPARAVARKQGKKGRRGDCRKALAEKYPDAGGGSRSPYRASPGSIK